MSNEDLIDRVRQLEDGVRFWKSLALGMAAALAVILAVATVAGVLLFSRAEAQRELEAERAASEAEFRALQEAMKDWREKVERVKKN